MKKTININTLIPKLKVRADVFLSSLIINILGLTLPIVMLQVYDRILGHHSVSTALLLFSVAFVAVVLDGIMRYLRALLLQYYGEPYALQAPLQLANKLLSSQTRHAPHSISHYFSHLNTLKHNYSGQSIVALLDLPFVFLYLYVLWFLAGNVVLVPLGLLAFAILSTVALSAHAQKLSLATEESEAYLWVPFYDYFFHKSDYLSHNLSDTENVTLNQNLSHHISNTARQAKLQSHLSSLIQALSQLSTIAVISVGAYKVIQGELTTGALAACSLLAGRCIAPVGALLNTGVQLQAKSIASKALQSIEEMDVGRTSFARTININQDILGEHHVTLVDSLAELFSEKNKDSGESKECITINAHCPLFAGTVLDNLTGYNDGLAPEALERASQLMLNDYFNKLPKGYESPVSIDCYDQYDMSVKSLIAIVRALVRQPDYIVLDHVLSSMDPATQNRLVSFIYSCTVQTFIIHDPLMPDLESFQALQRSQREAMQEQHEALMAEMEAAHV